MDRYSEMEMTKIARAEFKRGKALAEKEFKKAFMTLEDANKAITSIKRATAEKVKKLKEEIKHYEIMEWRGGHHTTFDLETKPLMDMIDKIFKEPKIK